MPKNLKPVYFEAFYCCSDQTGKVSSPVRASYLMVHRVQGKHPIHFLKGKKSPKSAFISMMAKTKQRKVQNIAAAPTLTPNWEENLISPWQSVYSLEQEN